MDLMDKREDKKTEHPGLKNLRPFSEMSEEEQRAIRSKGGKAAQAKLKARKTGRQIIEQLASMNLSPQQIDESLGEYAKIIGEDASPYTVMYAKAFLCANQGDIKAATFIRDTVGDKPDDKIQLETDAITDGDRELLRNVADTLAGMGVNITKPNDEV